jgi:hypothetical protein
LPDTTPQGHAAAIPGIKLSHLAYTVETSDLGTCSAIFEFTRTLPLFYLMVSSGVKNYCWNNKGPEEAETCKVILLI